MVSTVYGEWALLLESIRIGLQLGALYDGIRIIRMFMIHPAVVRDLEDALYWVISTLLILQLQLQKGQGVFRGFSIAAVFLTMIVYHRYLSNLWIPYLERGIKKLKNPLTKATKMLRIKLKRVTDSVIKGSKDDKEKISGSKKKAEPAGRNIGYDGSSCDDAGGSRK